MKHPAQELRICVWQIDGSARTFFQSEAELVNRTIAELHSGVLFSQDRIILSDGDAQDSFLPPRITRIDIVTDQVTVWDFPFAFGALIEISEAEFLDGVRTVFDPPDLRMGTRLFLDLETVSGQRTCLWMEIVAGFPATRMAQVYSLFKEQQLIFGLREGGIGVLNLANVVRFAIFPEPVPIHTANGSEHLREGKLHSNGLEHQAPEGESHTPDSFHQNAAHIQFHQE